jgi:hypothetical protein
MTVPLTYHPHPQHPRTTFPTLVGLAGALSATVLAAALPIKYLLSDWIPPIIVGYAFALLVSTGVAIRSAASLRARMPQRSCTARSIFALTILAASILLLRNTVLADVFIFRPGY